MKSPASPGSSSQRLRSSKRRSQGGPADAGAQPRQQTNSRLQDKTLRRSRSGDSGFEVGARSSSQHSTLSPFITEVLFKAIRGAIPDAGISISEWAEKYRYLSPERSARPGKWSNSLTPYLRGIMDACSDPAVWKVVFVKPNQVGGTEAANNLIGYRMHSKPSAVLYAAENEDKAKAWSTECLAPMLRDTPALAELVSEPKTRDSGNTIKAKKYPGGHLAIGWATSPATASSRPREVVILDEYDAYRPTIEGDYGELAILRTDTYEDRLIFIPSTPRDRLEAPAGAAIDAKRYSPIEREYEESDKRHYHVPCPHCKKFQPLRWTDEKGNRRVMWDEEPLLAYYICDNGCVIEEEAKSEMLARGKWIAERECRGVAGFHLNKLYSPFVTWGEVAEKFLKAKRSGDKNQLKVWVNTSLAEGWEEDVAKVETSTLVERREHYFGLVPRGALLLTAGGDVQGNRLELAVWGWGLNNECWAIDHVIVEGDPLHAETWNRLKAELLRKFAYEDGGELRIMATVIDTGFQPDQVRRFCRDNRGLRVFAGKGSSSYTAPLIGKPTLWGRPAIKLFSIGTNAAKDIIYAGLRVNEPGPGYCHFPIEEQKFDEAYFRQVVSEKRVMVKTGRKLVRAYEPIRAGIRNEALDCWGYARAALAIVNPNFTWLAERFAKRKVQDERAESGSEEEDPETNTEPGAIASESGDDNEPDPAQIEQPIPKTHRGNRHRRRRSNFGTRW